jgi:hypothetical protein
MKNNSTIILISSLFSIIFYGCLNDCKNYKPRNDYNAISQGYLNLVPYSGYDTITFLHNFLDTITFLGTGKKKIVTQENGNLGGCGPATIEHNDNYQYNFVSNSIQDKLIIEISFPGYFDCYFKNKGFKIPMSSMSWPFDLDSIVINERKIKDINYIPRVPKDTLYYNNEIGIVKFGFQSGEQWTLIKNN